MWPAVLPANKFFVLLAVLPGSYLFIAVCFARQLFIYLFIFAGLFAHQLLFFIWLAIFAPQPLFFNRFYCEKLSRFYGFSTINVFWLSDFGKHLLHRECLPTSSEIGNDE
ncbi:hypothetical protein OUZ56_005094 [Daphnia magna]|uniref:Uncharacterized protein n=1 Tax=Daphnia magna TaxID=35525 RepID=A0ABQ9YRT0_9CRUS|nr:hypothetical protein OUZ56_005094 [Daphnia magna]